MRRAIWRRESEARERPPKAISPPEGSSSPVRQRRRGVLPAPLGPTTARHSRRRTSRSRGPRMARAPERQASPRAARRVVGINGDPHTSRPIHLGWPVRSALRSLTPWPPLHSVERGNVAEPIVPISKNVDLWALPLHEVERDRGGGFGGQDAPEGKDAC